MRHGYPIRLSLSINALSLLSGRTFSFLPSKNSGFTLSGEQYPLSFCGKRGLPSLCFPRKHALAVRTGTSYLKEFLMKRWFKMLTGSLAVVLFITFSCAAFAAAPVKLRTAWLDEHEAFLVWYAKEKGWDKEEGLDIEMLLFSSGMAQLNALPAGEWVLPDRRRARHDGRAPLRDITPSPSPTTNPTPTPSCSAPTALSSRPRAYNPKTYPAVYGSIRRTCGARRILMHHGVLPPTSR